MKIRSLAAAALTFACLGAQAATIVSMGPALTSFGAVGVPGAGPALTDNLDLFNSSTGTLNGAKLKLSGNMTTIIDANAVTASTFRTQTTVDMGFDSSLAALDALLDPLFTFSLAGGPTGVQNLGAGGSAQYGPFSDSGALEIDLGGILSSLQAAGGGQFSISCNALAGLTNRIVGGNVDLSQKTDAGCGAEIVYSFTAAPPPAVPEPGSMALVGLALAGMSVASRRRAK